MQDDLALTRIMIVSIPTISMLTTTVTRMIMVAKWLLKTSNNQRLNMMLGHIMPVLQKTKVPRRVLTKSPFLALWPGFCPLI